MTEFGNHTVVAIHQPNFFPWLGYFDKIARADIFVVLDDVQFEKSGSGTWSNRVKLLIGGAPSWVTMPIRRDFQGVRAVSEMRIDTRQPWREKVLKTIRFSYARAPHLAEVFPLIEQLVNNPTDLLADYNLAAITSIRHVIGLPERPMVKSSVLALKTRATDRLIDLVKGVGGTAYLAGGGAAGYQLDAAFAHAGVELRFQRFDHPAYPQRRGAQFVPGLSILDAMFWCGLAETGDLLKRNIKAVTEQDGR